MSPTIMLNTIERSVYDFNTVSDLKSVLHQQEQEEIDDPRTSLVHAHWKLDNYDANTSVDHVNDPDEEAKRLQNLLEYRVLDAPRIPELEELTRSAQEMFQVPIAAISMIDLGRQYFLSLQGLEGVIETARDVAFCAHTIRRKSDCGALVVPDATKDVRFRNNPLVTGPLNVRFYAGAPIRSPEGYCLGVLCLIDTEPRPEGLCQQQKKTLQNLADCAMATILME